MKAIIFPGQGSQLVGMGKELFKEYPSLIAQADQILGYSVEELCLKDPDNKLHQTQYAQSALYIVNNLQYIKHFGTSHFGIDYFAGHSLGEYSALFAAKVFDFITGLKIVKLRAELMEKMPDGTMAAITGISNEKLFEVLQEAYINNVDIANYNTQFQMVISGPSDGIRAATELLENDENVRITPIKVNGAFHSRYMRPMVALFTNYLEGLSVSQPKVPVISNVSAKEFPKDPKEIKKLLVAQLTSPVKWYQTIQYLIDQQVRNFEELGPDHVLTDIVKQIRSENLSAPIHSNNQFSESYEEAFLSAVSNNTSKFVQEELAGEDWIPSFKGNTFVDLLQYRSKYQGDKTSFTYLLDGENLEVNISVRELDQRARAVAAYLQETSHVGQRILLVYQPGIEFIIAYFGCLYAGIIAVPTCPPIQKKDDERFERILKDSQAQSILLDTSVNQMLQTNNEFIQGIERLPLLISEKIAVTKAEAWKKPKLNQDSIAFLQYTSGSTGEPKGVIVTHRNLLHNAEGFKQGFGLDEKTVYVSWLPTYHDMGLIGVILQSVYLGVRCVLLSPNHFLQKPRRWLQAISKYQGTTSGAPNFAYELCCQRISDKDLRGLDLSSWKIAFNVAEPIRRHTIERFNKKFKKVGFANVAMSPGYGMSEATLLVTNNNASRDYRKIEVDAKQLKNNKICLGAEVNVGISIISCGRTNLDDQILIVDPETMTSIPENQVGEIWIKGDGVGRGYWNQPILSHEVFHAYTVNSLEGPFLRSGDLGFIHDGELFVTGRLKDLIIIRGVNHYPHDIELTVEHCHPEIRSGCVVAFSIESNDGEQLVVLAELRNALLKENLLEEVHQAIQEAIYEQHHLSLEVLYFLEGRSIPKTSNGKPQRRLCKAKYIENHLLPIAQWKENAKPIRDKSKSLVGPIEEIEQTIKTRLVEILAVNQQALNFEKSFGQLGLDLVKGSRLMEKIGDDFHFSPDPSSIYNYPNIHQLAAYIYQQSQRSKSPKINNYFGGGEALGIKKQNPNLENLNTDELINLIRGEL